MPSLLPILTSLYNLLQQCRFPAFWALYTSDKAESLRDNYTVECVGFEDAIRDVVIHAVTPAFKRIGTERLSTYLNLSGMFYIGNLRQPMDAHCFQGGDLNAYIEKLGWALENGVATIPPNPDNQITSTVVQENIQLPRTLHCLTYPDQLHSNVHLRCRAQQNHYTRSSCCISIVFVDYFFGCVSCVDRFCTLLHIDTHVSSSRA